MTLRILLAGLGLVLILRAIWPAKPSDLIPQQPHAALSALPDSTITTSVLGIGTPIPPAPETPVQRFLRTRAAWREASDAQRAEKTDLGRKADAAFREYMDAQEALEQAAKPPAPDTPGEPKC